MAAKSQPIKKNPLAWLTAQPFAHRGLHDAGQAAPENTMSAFTRAMTAGHGVELDVQVSFDGSAMVFHDETLERLTDVEGPIGNLTSARLREVKLKNSDQYIPSLDMVLTLIGGQVPILIEAKSSIDTDFHPLCFAIRRALEGYRGPVAVMSFDPRVVSWFARNAPKLIRGLVVSDSDAKSNNVFERLGWLRLFAIWRAKPNFIAYDVKNLPSTLSRKLRDNHIPLLTWTVRTAEERAIARDHADNIIYEAEMIAAH